MSHQGHGATFDEIDTEVEAEESDGAEIAEVMATAIMTLRADPNAWGAAYAHAGLMVRQAQSDPEREAYAKLSRFLLILQGA